jgi:hypothetical protein
MYQNLKKYNMKYRHCIDKQPFNFIITYRTCIVLNYAVKFFYEKLPCKSEFRNEKDSATMIFGDLSSVEAVIGSVVDVKSAETGIESGVESSVSAKLEFTGTGKETE